jgi:hypothetical protein
MRQSSSWKKVLLFGLLGAFGCLIGWLLGEWFLSWTMLPQTQQEARCSGSSRRTYPTPAASTS